VLLMHGEPSWSFLYRHMIPVLVAAGHRVVVPDLVGFGRSDKPAETTDYTYARHVQWMQALLVRPPRPARHHLLRQDWGGLVGLRLLSPHPIATPVVVGNTGLPEGDGKLSEAFLRGRSSHVSRPRSRSATSSTAAAPPTCRPK
jgi:haloalkane dehalogenase